ncbi:hypothetical protein [Candidatus Borrarchaeum sp.]|uniref:hypothetical protein n=1 Tax=Candidatus Borrarchaeum sp. TaxID=2846742 RepID=UPI00257BB1B5|nr:hypothetical protein [Candidatus Borrarchaeum sp.]
MRWSSNKSLTFFISALLVISLISLALMTAPTAAQEEKSKELTLTETDSFYIDNDFIQIKFVKKRPVVEWYSKETNEHRLALSVLELQEFFDSDGTSYYDSGDVLYREFDVSNPNNLQGQKFDVTKSVSANSIELTFRARGDIVDTEGDKVGFGDVSFIFTISASDSGAASYAPQDGVEMSVEVVVSDWEYFNKDNNILALNSSLKMQSGDSATINGESVQPANDYTQFKSANVHLLSVSNSTNEQMGYVRLADKDNKDTRDFHAYKAFGTQIVIMSTYYNIGKSTIHQMSIGVPESISSPTDQGTGGFGFGDIGSIFQGFPGILSNILFIEVVVVAAVLVTIVVLLVRRVKKE